MPQALSQHACIKAAQQRVPSLWLQLLVRSMQTETARSQSRVLGHPWMRGRVGQDGGQHMLWLCACVWDEEVAGAA